MHKLHEIIIMEMIDGIDTSVALGAPVAAPDPDPAAVSLVTVNAPDLCFPCLVNDMMF